jgi:hypothetical protein
MERELTQVIRFQAELILGATERVKTKKEFVEIKVPTANGPLVKSKVYSYGPIFVGNLSRDSYGKIWDPSAWAVVHERSGLKINRSRGMKLKQAKYYAKNILGLTDWSKSDIEISGVKELGEMLSFIEKQAVKL